MTGCNDTLDQTDTVGPPPVNHEHPNKAIHASSPIPNLVKAWRPLKQ